MLQCLQLYMVVFGGGWVGVRAVVLCTRRCARMCAYLTLFHSGRGSWARMGGARMSAHLLLSADVHHSCAQKHKMHLFLCTNVAYILM